MPPTIGHHRQTSDLLYEISGRCFASSLRYPSLNSLLDKSTYFTADLTHNTISDIHVSESFAALTRIYRHSTLDDVLSSILITWIPDPSGDDLHAVFSRPELIRQFGLGETFFTAYYDCILSGIKYHKQLSCLLSRHGSSVTGIFLVLDLTDTYDESMRMMRRAEYDGLTGLYNKSASENSISSYLASSPSESSVLIIIDIDHFKRFNDQYGHETGDIVLRSTARSLERFFGRDSVIGRNGGDEFIVLLKHRTDSQVIDEIGRFSNENHFIKLNNNICRFTFSIGYAMYPEQGESYSELVTNADMAMYNVKMDKRDSFIKYSPEMAEQKRTLLSFNLSDIVSGIPGAILVYKADEKEEILFANDQLYALFECSSMEELLKFSGDSFRNIVHPDDLDRVERSITRQINSNPEGLDYVSYRIITKNGKIREVDDIGHLVNTPKYGDIFYVFLYDRRQKEDILRKAGEPVD